MTIDPEVDPESAQRVEELLDGIRHMRTMYGYKPDPPTPLSIAEMKEGERRNAIKAIGSAIATLRGTKSGHSPISHWYAHNPVSPRELPEFAVYTIPEDCWTDAAARGLLRQAWSAPEWPGQVPQELWMAAFAHVGALPVCQADLADDDEEAPGCGVDHDTTIQVWRAAFATDKRGMAWTTDPGVATWFANRGDLGERGRVMRIWTTQVTPDRVLAHINSRSESEIVCDVSGLRLRDVTDELIPTNAVEYDRMGGHWWITCDQDHQHYGEHGAAGVLLRHRASDGTTSVLLHKRSAGTDHAGTYAYPGGAIQAGETAEAAARREAAEEHHLDDLPAVADTYVLDHGGWSYTTFIIDVTDQSLPTHSGWEAEDAEWVTQPRLDVLPLHDGARAAISHAMGN